MNIKEHDVVVLDQDCPEARLTKGTIGTIVSPLDARSKFALIEITDHDEIVVDVPVAILKLADNKALSPVKG
jgi:Domain of unknown function (DUF4926)